MEKMILKVGSITNLIIIIIMLYSLYKYGFTAYLWIGLLNIFYISFMTIKLSSSYKSNIEKTNGFISD